MVHLGRLSSGKRIVLEISEIAGIENGEIKLNPLFIHTAEKGFARTENRMIHAEKLKMKGYEDDGLSNL
jgi:pilus assembly protein CpaF